MRSSWPRVRLRSRQVNLLLALALAGAIATGLGSWMATDRWGGALIVAHAVGGLAVLLLAPAKLRGPVAAGFRRGRPTRWLSATFGLLVLASIALGALHASGLWYGVGAWSPLWTHTMAAFVLVPLLVWHLATRPVLPRATDFDRRALIAGGLALGGAATLYVALEGLARLLGTAGAERRFTGSHEVGSHQPAEMPSVIWFDDQRPQTTHAATWSLTVDGASVSIESLWERAQPVVATLDCTGGWCSTQAWDAVPLGALVTTRHGRSVRVRSQTGYDRYFGYDELERVYLAVGYGGSPLRPGHGAPVRLIVPGRRGPWWVKWVVSVEPSERPPWLQPPLPFT